jgi:glutaredoxin
VATLELYGTRSCPYTQELRESLEWDRREFEEYDIEIDPEAEARVCAQSTATSTLFPVLVEDGKVIQVGWHGRGCFVGKGA